LYLGGVNKQLVASVHVEMSLVDGDQFLALAKQGFQQSDMPSSLAHDVRYLIVRLQNTSNRAIWGTLRVSVRDGTDIDLVVHLDAGQPFPAIYVSHIGGMRRTDGYPRFEWARLGGK